jgi:hypothetical protein
MSYEKTNAECEYCEQRFMSTEIARQHELVCEENDDRINR